MRMVLWQYRRFDEDAVPWLRLERVEDKRLPVVRIDEQPALCFSSCGVGGSRIRSIVKRSTLRVAGGDCCEVSAPGSPLRLAEGSMICPRSFNDVVTQPDHWQEPVSNRH